MFIMIFIMPYWIPAIAGFQKTRSYLGGRTCYIFFIKKWWTIRFTVALMSA
jgi:hypothetical protein